MSPDLRATDVAEGSTLGDALAGPGRGCGGCAVSGGFGCVSFLVGSIVAVVLFAPQLLGGWFARGATTLLTDLVDLDLQNNYVRGAIHNNTLVNGGNGGPSYEVGAGSNYYYVNPYDQTYIGTEAPIDGYAVPEGYQQMEEQ